MKTKERWWSAVLLAMVLGLPFAGMSQAQTTTKTEVRKFEVIAVDGNNLTVRNENGTQQYTVPDDFRFTIDGKKLSVKQLKPGMKGTATVTTTTTVWPVTVTEIKERHRRQRDRPFGERAQCRRRPPLHPGAAR